MQEPTPAQRPDQTAAILRVMQDAGLPELVRNTFVRHYEKIRAGESGRVHQSTIHPPGKITAYADLPEPGPAIGGILSQTLLLKLNGGLGTGMGLDRAKSLLVAKEGLSFLEIIVRQVLFLREAHGVDLPLILMNSFRTRSDTEAVLARHPALSAGQGSLPLGFLQHKVPKLEAETLAPADWPSNPDLAWCPPGHGDIYTALVTSGILVRLLDEGYRYAFVSNADNLGATLDLQILDHVASTGTPFMMEVTERTEADRKGGHLAESSESRLLLLRERAQCPDDELDAFEDVKRYRYFNTNNLWIDLRSLSELLEVNDQILDLPLIVNRKTLDPSDASSPEVLQLETAMGAAISVFPGATALCVPRTRFAPVKSTEDLLAVRSDLYEMTPSFQVRRHPGRKTPPPAIRLDPAYYKLLPDFESRFPSAPPSLLHCDSLRVEGDIRFGADVVLRGEIALRNTSATQAVLGNQRIEGTGEPIELGT